MNTVTVIGGGPAGLTAARKLAETGWQVAVLEEHKQVGKPVNCAGLISKSGVEINKLNVKDCIVNEVHGAKIFAPNGTMLELNKFETIALVIDREKFDKNCLQDALKVGVEVRSEARMLNVKGETIFLQQKKRGEMIKSKIVVGADGVNSNTRKLMELHVPSENFVNSCQFKVKGRFEKKFVQLHFGSFAKNFFAWVIPESKEVARIGLGTTVRENARQKLQEFIQKHDAGVQVLEETNSLIPIGEPLKGIVKDNLLLVGDAAFQTKASSGGGLVTGAMAAGILAETISNNLRHKKPLTDFEKNLSSLNKELHLHWKIRKYLNSLDDARLNELFEKLKKARIEQFLEKHGNMDLPSLFIGRFFRQPRVWPLMGEAMKIIMG